MRTRAYDHTGWDEKFFIFEGNNYVPDDEYYEVDYRVEIVDEVKIILGANATLHFHQGIQLSKDCSLKVYSENLKAPGKIIIDSHNNWGPAVGPDYWKSPYTDVYPTRFMGDLTLDGVTAEIKSYYRFGIGSCNGYGGSLNVYASHVTIEGVTNGIGYLDEINFNNGSIDVVNCGVDANSMVMNEGRFSASYLEGDITTNLITGEDMMLKYSSTEDFLNSKTVKLDVLNQTEILSSNYIEIMREDERGLHLDVLQTGSCFLCHHTYKYNVNVYYKHGQTEPKVITLNTTQDAKSYIHKYDFTFFYDIPATNLVNIYLKDGTPLPYNYFDYKPGQELDVYLFWRYTPTYHCCEKPWIYNHYYNALTDLYYNDEEQLRPIGDATAFHYWSQLDGEGYRPVSPHVDKDKNGWCDVCGCTGSIHVIFHTLMDTMFSMAPDVVCESSNTFMYAYNKYIKGKFTYPGSLQYLIWNGKAINQWTPIPLTINEVEDLYGFFKFDKETYKRKAGHKEYYFNSYTGLFYEDYAQKTVIGNWNALQEWLLGKGRIDPNPAEIKSFLFYNEATKKYQEKSIPTNAVYFDNEYSSCLLEGGWYVFTDTFSLSGEVHVYGDTRIILANGCKVTFEEGLNIYPDARLTIYTQTLDNTKAGKITAISSRYCPGIGAIEIETDRYGEIIRGSDLYIYGGNYNLGSSVDSNNASALGLNTKKMIVRNANISGSVHKSVISAPDRSEANFYNCNINIKATSLATDGPLNFYGCEIKASTEVWPADNSSIFDGNLHGGSLELETSIRTPNTHFDFDNEVSNSSHWSSDANHEPKNRQGWRVTPKSYIPEKKSSCSVHGHKAAYYNANNHFYYEDAEHTILIGDFCEYEEWVKNGEGCLPLAGTCVDNNHDGYCDGCGRDESNGSNFYFHYSHRLVSKGSTYSERTVRDVVSNFNEQIEKVFDENGKEVDLDQYFNFDESEDIHLYCLTHYPANDEHEEFYCNTYEGKYYKADGVTEFDYHPANHKFDYHAVPYAVVHENNGVYSMDYPCIYFGCDECKSCNLEKTETIEKEATCTENQFVCDLLSYYQIPNLGSGPVAYLHREVPDTALGHKYVISDLSWDDNECVAKSYCQTCGEEITETAVGEYVKDSDPTCTENEKGHYECRFENPVFGVQKSPTVEIENTALGHDFSKNVEYTWDGILCTVHAECAHVGCHETITETAQAEYFEEKHSTCKSLSTGHYEITFKSDFIGSTATEEGSVQIEHSDQQHVFGGQVLYEVEGNTCTASWGCVTDGCFEREYETVIGEYVKDSDGNCVEHEKGHYEFVFEKAEFGSYRTETNSVEGPTIPNAHLFSETVNYEVNGDQCTAIITYQHDGCKEIISETVTGEYVKDSDGTCVEHEYGHYEFVFENTQFGSYRTEANSVEGPIIPDGHSFTGNVNYVINGDQCTATITCQHDGCNEVITETVTGVYIKDSVASNKQNEKGHYVFIFKDARFGICQTEANSLEVPGTMTKGCAGSLVYSSTLFMTIALTGAALCFIRKKQIRKIK